MVFNYGNAPVGCTGVGVKENEAVKFSLYYDPSADALVVDDLDGHACDIMVLDATGRILDHLSATERTGWSMAKYSAGSYIAHIVSEERSSTYRFVKPHQ